MPGREDGERTGAQRLAWHNRRVLAERLGWPEGVLQLCEETEPAHPNWRLSWHTGDATFTATHAVRHISYRYVRSQTIDGLAAKMAEADAQAAEQRAEWELFSPPGWTSMRSQ